MPPREVVEARPRSTTEILDDAWRVYLADAPLLLALTALFFLPAMTCLVALVCLPVDSTWWTVWLLPLATSLLWPLTGLSAGACQEAYHSWAESYPIRFGECLRAAWQRGLHHVASQALAVLPPCVMLVALVAPLIPKSLRMSLVGTTLLLWVLVAMFGLSRQVSLAAGQTRFWRAFKHSVRATAQHSGRALVVVVLRAALVLLAALNLHLFLHFGLWTAENLGGFDVAFLGVVCSVSNTAYVLTVVLVALWLLSPWNEAVSWLFFVDARTRYDGLDLWQRVNELFPVKVSSKAGAVLLALATGLFGSAAAQAEEPLQAVRGARQELAVIRKEVRTADPYPGSRYWVGRLSAVGDRLDRSEKGLGSYRWFRQAEERFAGYDRQQALTALDDLDAQLALIEDSWTRLRPAAADEPAKDYIKGLVPPDQSRPEAKKKPNKDQASKPQEPPPADDGVNQGGGWAGGPPAGPGIVGPASLGGAAYPVLLMLVGLAAAALLAGISFAVIKWWQQRKPAAPQGYFWPGPHITVQHPHRAGITGP